MRYRIEGELKVDLEGEVWVDPSRDFETALADALLCAERNLRISISPDGFRLSVMIGPGVDDRMKVEWSEEMEPALEITDCLD